MTQGKYDDIIHLPAPEPRNRPRMSARDRAAQFAPFAALTGYEAVVEEAARLTDVQTELSEDMKTILSDKMQRIADHLESEPFVTITYFVPDKRKAGGKYVDALGVVDRIDEYERCIVMRDETVIPIDRVRAIEGDLFRENEI